jgi:hypothetical protein
MKKVGRWLKTRSKEGSTWAGLAAIAVALGAEPFQTASIAQAISLVLGGGLIAAGPLPTAEAAPTSTPGAKG